MQQQTADARALTYEGLSALDRGQSDRATELFNQAADLSPDDHRIQEHLAASLSSQGQLDQAIEQMKKAVDLSENEPRLHVQLGHLYFKRNQPHLAEHHSRQALNNDRRNFEAWKLLGQAQAAQNKLDDALASLHRAASYNSDDRQVSFEIASVYQRQGRSSRALAAIETLRGKYPTDREPIELLSLEGDVLLSMKQPHRAVSRLARVTGMDNVNADALLALAKAYKMTGDVSNARLAAALAAEQFPTDQRFATLLSDLPNSVSAGIVDSGIAR